MKRLWLRIPRPWRAMMNILAILVLAVAFYISIDAPTFTREQALRRTEKENLVGPSEILFNQEVENYRYGHLILAETDHGIITWVDDSTFGFNYHEKTGDLTVVTGPKYWFNWGSDEFEVCLPIFLVDDHPEAVRAELELDVEGFFVHNSNSENLQEPLDHHFSLEAQREAEGYFFFTVDLPMVPQGEQGSNGYALDALAQHFTNWWRNALPESNFSITATVRLYDGNNDLIVTRDMVLRTMTEE